MRAGADGAAHVLTLILAGGQGERLRPLTERRAKPAVPFGATYRIIDFALSNAVNSGLRRICVLTQYESLTLHRHLRSAWNILSPELDEFIYIVSPEQRLPDRWYAGTADAVFQNLSLLQHEQPGWVLILGGDHIYKMDYRPLLQQHMDKGADVTVVCMDVPLEEASRFGVVETGADGRIKGFQEKPANPRPTTGFEDRALASMGIYLFNTEALVRAVVVDAKIASSSHDFGNDVLPGWMADHGVFAYNFNSPQQPGAPYWRDVGTLDSYWQANMDLLDRRPELDLYDTDWPIRSGTGHRPPGKICVSTEGAMGVAEQSLLAPGAVISGGHVKRSVVGPRVEIHNGSKVEECVLMGGVHVGKGVRLRRCIAEETAYIPDGTTLGHDLEIDRRKFKVSEQGILVVPKRAPLP
jgi:glucose-1-phosphate adenylyltransferase